MINKIYKEFIDFYYIIKSIYKKPSKFYDDNLKKSFLYNIGFHGLQNISYNLMIIITVPYLINVIGPNKYSSFLFILSFLNLLDVIIDYGFFFTGVRLVANCENNVEREKVFISILQIKIFLLLVSIIIVFIIGKYTNILKYDLHIFYIGYLLILGNIFLSGYYFRGLNDFKPFNITSIVSNIGMVILVLLFINKESNIEQLVFFQGIAVFIPSLVLIFLIIKKFEKVLVVFKPDFNHIKYLFSHSLNNAYTRFLLSFFFMAHLFIIGQLVKDDFFSAYAISYKIVITISNFFTAIFLPSFSLITKINIENEKEKLFRYFKTINIFSFILHFVIMLILFVSGKFIIENLLGYNDFYINYSINYFIILLYLLPASLNYNFNSILIVLKKDNLLLKNNLIGIVFFVLFIVLLFYIPEHLRNIFISGNLFIVITLIVILNYFSFKRNN
jgi:PST family polysaccharide transporter